MAYFFEIVPVLTRATMNEAPIRLTRWKKQSSMETMNNCGTIFEQSKAAGSNETQGDNRARHFGYGRRRPGEASYGENRVANLCFNYLSRLGLPPNALDGCFIDDASTALKPFHGGVLDRPEAFKMRGLIRPGDHVIVADLAQCFASADDMRAGIEILLNVHRANVHLVELGIVLPRDKDSPAYRLIEGMRTTADRWCRETAADIEGVKQNLMYEPKRGAKIGGKTRIMRGKTPRLHKRVRQNRKSYLELDLRAVGIAQEIVRLRAQGLSWSQAADKIEEGLAAHENRPAIPRSAWKPREWSIDRCRGAVKALDKLLKSRHASS